MSSGIRKLLQKLEAFFLKKGYILFVIGFLLGRALILSTLTPFILPFFAAVYVIRKERAPIALVGLVVGAATLSVLDATYAFGSTVFFLFLFRVALNWLKQEVKALPFFVFATIIISKLAKSFMVTGQISLFDGMMAGVEASLGFILTLIFLQSIPLILANKRRQTLKTEEVVCLIIMLASIMTGTIGWSVYDLSLEHITSRYLVLVFAFVAGATVGSTVGVVTGLIFSLANVSSFYHMSLLAFAGLLGGLLKEGKKIGVVIGLFISTLLIGMYGEGSGNLDKTLLESAAAMILFLLTPQGLTSKLAKYIPGTPEYAAEQQHYMRKMRDVTAQRVEQFSSVFQALSNSFASYDELSERDDPESRELDYFLSNVTEKTCQMCFKKEHCWARNFNTTYDYMKEIMHEMDQNDGTISPKLARDWGKHCTKSQKVMNTIQQEAYTISSESKVKKTSSRK